MYLPPLSRSCRRSLLFVCTLLLHSPTWAADAAATDFTASRPERPANAETTPAGRPFGTQFEYDGKYILTAPLRWDTTTWKWFGAAAAGVLVTGTLLDRREGDPKEDSQNRLDKLASKLEPFGAGYSFATLAAFYGAGKLFDSPRSSAVAEDGLTASLIAAGIISPAIKWIVGRVRPADTSSSTDFHPFGHNHSFPSGHTTQAFTVATVISRHYDSPFIDAGAYTVAALVGYARHQHQAHWASDIAAGALLGITVGRTVVRLNDENRGVRITVVPSDNGPMAALVLPLD